MRVGVIGLGRFGRLWATLMQEHADAVYVWNRSDRPHPEGTIRLTDDDYATLDVVFLCTSISSVAEVGRHIAPRLAPHTIVADTCSVKVLPMQILREVLPPENPLLGTHPMFGPDSARDGAAGLPMVLCRERIQDDAYVKLRSFLEKYSMQLLEMTADEHDKEAAYTQGITHFIGRVMKDLDLQASPIATLGYTRLLQVMEQTCNDPWTLFVDLQQQNPYTAEMRRRIKHSLDRFLHILDNEDTATGPPS